MEPRWTATPAPRFRRTYSLLSVLVLVLTAAPGCEDEPDTTAALKQQSAITGQITASDGAPVAGAVIIATHRFTHAPFETTTDAAGAYVLAVDEGPYDVGVYAQGYFSAYRGPVVADPVASLSLRLSPAADVDPGRLEGQITGADGTPLAGVTVTLHGNEGNEPGFPDHVQSSTDADGVYRFEGIPDGWLNLTLSGGGMEQEEVVDVYKIEAHPCEVDLAANTDTPNGWQDGMWSIHDPSDPDDLFSSGDIAPPANAASNGASCTVTPTKPFKPDGTWYLVRGCGEATYETVETLHEIVAQGDCPLPGCWSVRARKEKTWTCRYVVEIDLPTKNSAAVFFKFTDNDAKKDTYRLSVFETMMFHTVRYDCNPLKRIGSDTKASISKLYYSW